MPIRMNTSQHDEDLYLFKQSECVQPPSIFTLMIIDNVQYI
jgi:hypothetical protein